MTLLAVASCTGGGPNGASQTDRNKSSTTRILRRGLQGEPKTLDPQEADDTWSFPVVRDLYEGLTAEDRNGHIEPGLAQSWTIDSSGTVYDFLIRPGARWSNGDPIKAEEFVAGLRRAADPRTSSGSAALLSIIRGATDVIAGKRPPEQLSVSAPTDRSVRIVLEHPAPFVLQILSQPIAAPLHRRPEIALTPSDKRNLVTNGAYELVTRVPGAFIELKRNQNYWNAVNVAVETVRYVNAESEATEIREYEADQIDITSSIPAPDLARITRRYGAEVQTAPILGTLYLGLDVTEPPLGDKRDLRQALSMSVERELIAEHVIVGVTPAYSFVANGISGYSPPTYDWAAWPREQRIRVARQLYARAGYSDAHPLRLKLYFNAGESIQRIMIAIAAGWKENLGVSATLVSDEFRVFLSGRKDRSRWDVARLGWYADYDDPSSFLEVFTRNNVQNDPGYASAEFNSEMDSARIEPNPEHRLTILRRAEETLLNDYPVIPVYFYTARRLVKPNVGGAQISPLNHTYSKHLYWKK